jgi:ABC-2 type transport system permease protein
VLEHRVHAAPRGLQGRVDLVVSVRWLQGFAANQPVSVFDNALRALTQGPGAAAALGHDTTYLVVAAIAWCAGIAVVFTAITLRLYKRL